MGTDDITLTIRSRRLLAAKVVGASALAAIGQFAVDMPEGFFGAAGRVTAFGVGFSVGAGMLGGLVAWAALTARAWAWRSAFGVFALHLGFYLPALASDTLVAGALIFWFLLLALGQLFPASGIEAPGSARDADGPVARLVGWMSQTGPAARHLAGVAVLAGVWVAGFELDAAWPALGLCLALHAAALIVMGRFWILAARAGHRRTLLALLPLAMAPFFAGMPRGVLALLAVHQVAVLLVLVTRGTMFRELLQHFLKRPALLGMLGFIGTIALGTLMLSFPAASASGQAISPLDALFTSTSATCVTGLVVLDTPTHFSLFGQGVILGLIQVGGIGIILLSTFATLLLGGRLSLRGEQALAEALESIGSREAYRLTLFAVLSTLAIEAVGAFLLTSSFLRHGLDWGEAVWRGCFHAVSAFCNAGFALQPDSLLMFQRDPFALGVIGLLIVLGGIGFLVLAGSLSWLRGQRPAALRVQIQVVWWVTLALVLSGTALFCLTEWNASLQGLGPVDKLSNALFQSLTLRTAGFNSVDLGARAPGTSLYMLVFMFVGASPGGAGGGIKTTTFLVLLASIRAIARGESRLVLFRHQVPQSIVYRSAAIAAISLGLAFAALFGLLVAEGGSFEALAFEVFSALGTVGLSLGATAELGPVGKLIIVAVMFVGRLGPLSLALMLGRHRESRVGYPEVRFMVG
jgi:trk system potassium uptake protein TrkH